MWGKILPSVFPAGTLSLYPHGRAGIDTLYFCNPFICVIEVAVAFQRGVAVVFLFRLQYYQECLPYCVGAGFLPWAGYLYPLWEYANWNWHLFRVGRDYCYFIAVRNIIVVQLRRYTIALLVGVLLVTAATDIIIDNALSAATICITFVPQIFLRRGRINNYFYLFPLAVSIRMSPRACIVVICR
jgi:hypothetical protein